MERNKISRRNRNTSFVIFFVIGIILMLQLKSEKDSNIFLNRENLRDMELQLMLESNEADRLDEYLQRKVQELEEVQSVENDVNLKNMMEKQKNYARILGGYTNYKGPGIQVEIWDSDVEILPTQNPNDYVVHDQDMLNIINDLKVAGAEAVSVNNQILRADSVIKCSGATITVDDRTFGQPFVIRAIGEIHQLEAALKAKDSYAFMIESLYGIRIKITAQESIDIMGGQASRNYSYLKEELNS